MYLFSYFLVASLSILSLLLDHMFKRAAKLSHGPHTPLLVFSFPPSLSPWPLSLMFKHTLVVWPDMESCLDVTSRHPCSKSSCLWGSAQMGKCPVDLRLGEKKSKVNAFIRAPLIWNQADNPVRPELPTRFSGFPPIQPSSLWCLITWALNNLIYTN